MEETPIGTCQALRGADQIARVVGIQAWFCADVRSRSLFTRAHVA